MTYSKVVKAEFISRPNRFIANVKLNGKEKTVHVKNTGRCRELLLPGSTVYLAKGESPTRKTEYDLIAVEKVTENGAILINMDSQIPNQVCEELLRSGTIFSRNAKIRREYTHKSSRFDFYIEDGDRKVLLEVKGCTLESEGVASFPDAPTERGVKHVRELISAIAEGYEAYIVFIIQMKGVYELRPNDITHKEFGDALREAEKSGVKILAFDCIVTPDTITFDKDISINLNTGVEIL